MCCDSSSYGLNFTPGCPKIVHRINIIYYVGKSTQNFIWGAADDSNRNLTVNSLANVIKVVSLGMVYIEKNY